MKYSQNNEEQIIANYFGNHKGTFLSLGENDGETLSNVRSLAIKGWNGLCVEPAPMPFYKLSKLYKNSKVKCLQFAITDYSGHIDFYHSGNHIGSGDTDLISTTEPVELLRWPDVHFTKTSVPCITFADLLKKTKFKIFDFISIDIEGAELKVLPQIDFTKLETKLVCVEYNGKNKMLFDKIFNKFTLIHQNQENLIYGK